MRNVFVMPLESQYYSGVVVLSMKSDQWTHNTTDKTDANSSSVALF